MLWHTRRAATQTPQESGTPVECNSAHPSEDNLERYAMGVIRDEAELACVEEHLLACPACAERTEALEDYIWKIRGSLRQYLIDVIESPQ